MAEATALLTELENQEPMSETDTASSSAGADNDTLENPPSAVHFTTDPIDDNDVFDVR